MLNKELLRDIKWIKEDKNQRLIYLPPFFNLYKSINEKINRNKTVKTQSITVLSPKIPNAAPVLIV